MNKNLKILETGTRVVYPKGTRMSQMRIDSVTDFVKTLETTFSQKVTHIFFNENMFNPGKLFEARFTFERPDRDRVKKKQVSAEGYF